MVCVWVCAWESECDWCLNPFLQAFCIEKKTPKPGPIHLLKLESRRLESFLLIRIYTNIHNIAYQDTGNSYFVGSLGL